ncbi:hypothetical protein [Kordia sp.]|uniref:hypothetical protein n=1 Tax=Kordia sp. TaxID=1965332 RepID=UPI003D265A70
MKKRTYLVFLLLMAFQFGIAQIAPEEEVDKNTTETFEKTPRLKGLLLGIHGARETMFEIGYFDYLWVNEDGKIPAIGGFGYSLTTEHYINQNYIIAPKVALWANAIFLNIGMSFPWYFDMEKNNSFRLRPEIGLASGSFKITFATNMAITNKDMPNVSKYMASVICFLNFNKKANGIKEKINFLGM